MWTRSGPRSFKAEWRAAGSGDMVQDTIELESQHGDAVVLYRAGLNGRYFGTLSADGRFIWGHASWYGAGDRWAAEIHTEAGPAKPQGEIKPPAAPVIDPGTRWHVQELAANGDVYEGVWTRSGPRSFKAEWRLVRTGETASDVIELEKQYGNVLVLYRRSLKGRYFGTISRDGRFIQGHASWYAAGDRWSAEVR